MMVTTVIIFGRTRSTAPSMIARCSSATPGARPSARQRARISCQAWSR